MYIVLQARPNQPSVDLTFSMCAILAMLGWLGLACVATEAGYNQKRLLVQCGPQTFRPLGNLTSGFVQPCMHAFTPAFVTELQQELGWSSGCKNEDLGTCKAVDT